MKRNVEIKARVQNVARVRAKIESICCSPPQSIFQEDIYFHVLGMRKKLRVFDCTHGQIIEYTRENKSGPKISMYTIEETYAPEKIYKALLKKYKVRNVVRKQRLVFILGRTRIHLDSVAMLGNFLELEVVLEEGESEESGMNEAKRLIREVGIKKSSDLVRGSYLELIDSIPNNKIQPTSFGGG